MYLVEVIETLKNLQWLLTDFRIHLDTCSKEVYGRSVNKSNTKLLKWKKLYSIKTIGKYKLWIQFIFHIYTENLACMAIFFALNQFHIDMKIIRDVPDTLFHQIRDTRYTRISNSTGYRITDSTGYWIMLGKVCQVSLMSLTHWFRVHSTNKKY